MKLTPAASYSPTQSPAPNGGTDVGCALRTKYWWHRPEAGATKSYGVGTAPQKNYSPSWLVLTAALSLHPAGKFFEPLNEEEETRKQDRQGEPPIESGAPARNRRDANRNEEGNPQR